MKWNHLKTVAVLLALLFAGLLSGGCASLRTQPFPDTQNHLTISVNRHQFLWIGDIPVKTTRFEKTNIFISNIYDAEPHLSTFWLFDAAFNKNNSEEVQKKLMRTATDILLNLEKTTDQCLQKELDVNKDNSRLSLLEPTYEPVKGMEKLDFWDFFKETSEPANIQITPYLVFSFVDEEKARLWLCLNVVLFDKTLRDTDLFGNPRYQKPDWFCRYIVSIGEPLPLAAKGGWFPSQSRNVEGAMAKEIKKAVEILLEDINGKLRSDKPPRKKIKGKWVFFSKPHEVEVEVLKSANDGDVVLPLVGDDQYFSGVNILPSNFDESLGFQK